MPHWQITSKFIEILRDRSIVSYSQDIRMPDLDRAELQHHAMPHYHEKKIPATTIKIRVNFIAGDNRAAVKAVF